MKSSGRRQFIITTTIKNAPRLKVIVAVFAKHGFYNIAEKIKLGRYFIERMSSEKDVDHISMPERIRLSFEELGPTFIKLGQLLATRPDLVPVEFVNEFEKLHDRVMPISFNDIEPVLISELGLNYKDHFEHIDPVPLGSASIAQVYKATLKSGEQIVLKVQRPGIDKIIEEDLNVLYFLADLLDHYIPEVRPFNPKGIIDEYFKTLELETSFIVEANNIRRFRENFKNENQVVIPKVYFEYTTEKVLVMEAFKGFPLSHPQALVNSELDKESIIKAGLKAYMKMVFKDGLFHGDLHPGNFFALENHKIGLIDFGVVGRLNLKTQSAVASMLIALAQEDYERIAFEYVDLAPYSDKVNVDLFAKDLRELIAPYYGLTLKNVNLGKILMNTSSIAAKHGLSVPTELMLFFKSIVAVEGLGRKIQQDFDFLKYTIDIASEFGKSQFETSKITHDAGVLFRESKNLIANFPRQINLLLRKINSPDHHFEFNLPQLESIKKSIEKSQRLLFLGLIISALILSGAYISTHPANDYIGSLPSLAFLHYLLAFVLGFISFINYIRR